MTVNLDELYKRIYDVMKSTYEAPDLCHDVAADFSERELTSFVETYHAYLMK